MVERSNKELNFQKGEILLFDKELNWTSFNMVQKVRSSICKKLGIKKLKVGHAGTLDPLATGLLIICTGKATKQINTFQEQEKEYIAQLKIGTTTPSYDMETEEEDYRSTDHVTKELFETVISKFRGRTEQIPPVFSAVKVDGKRAFDYARRGETPILEARPIEISELTIEEFSLPFITIRMVCSKGTYVRALARDIGEALNCGAYLTGLRRTRIGKFSVDNTLTIKRFLEILDDNETI